MAITKSKKENLVSQYQEWVGRSHSMVLMEYLGLSVKDLDELRGRVREVGGEFHIVKNTLTKLAFESTGHPLADDFFVGTTAIGFAFEDAPALAKVLSDFARASEHLKIKGGYLGQDVMTAKQVFALAELPPLPVMRARLLGTLQAPATRLARALAEPARQVAQVIKAYADSEAALEAA